MRRSLSGFTLAVLFLLLVIVLVFVLHRSSDETVIQEIPVEDEDEPEPMVIPPQPKPVGTEPKQTTTAPPTTLPQKPEDGVVEGIDERLHMGGGDG